MNLDIDRMDEEERKKTRNRLLIQSKRLNNEIRQLEVQLDELFSTNDIEKVQDNKINNEGIAKHREEIVIQERYIRQLKNKIEFLKSANAKDNANFIIKEEDELKIKKKEYEQLLIQKELMNKRKDDKEKALSKIKPFQDHKKQIQASLAQARKSNSKMQMEIVELQRETRKYHNYLTMNRSMSTTDKKQKQKQPHNAPQIMPKSMMELEIVKAESQIKEYAEKTRKVEQKYKTQIDSLDNQLFKLKTQHSKVREKLNEVEKQHRMWLTRKNGLRSQQEMQQFRERLSKIVPLSPDKLLKIKTPEPIPKPPPIVKSQQKIPPKKNDEKDKKQRKSAVDLKQSLNKSKELKSKKMKLIKNEISTPKQTKQSQILSNQSKKKQNTQIVFVRNPWKSMNSNQDQIRKNQTQKLQNSVDKNKLSIKVEYFKRNSPIQRESKSAKKNELENRPNLIPQESILLKNEEKKVKLLLKSVGVGTD